MKFKFSWEDNFKIKYLSIFKYAYWNKEILWKVFEKEYKDLLSFWKYPKEIFFKI